MENVCVLLERRGVLQSNDIEERTFGRAITTALEKGRGKCRNIMIIGPANRPFYSRGLSTLAFE